MHIVADVLDEEESYYALYVHRTSTSHFSWDYYKEIVCWEESLNEQDSRRKFQAGTSLIKNIPWTLQNITICFLDAGYNSRDCFFLYRGYLVLYFIRMAI